jgi:hypothetical protein
MDVELYKISDAKDYRAVYAELKDDELVVSTHDMGAKVEEFWGRDEYEFWATVPKKAWGELAIALIREHLADNSRATDKLRDICEKWDVPHDWDSWP